MASEREPLSGLDPRVINAVQELEELVRDHYPGTTFEVSPAPDEPESILLWATVDVDDPDEVMGLVIDRLIDLQVEENIPLHLVPILTPERILAELRAEPRARRRLHVRVSSSAGKSVFAGVLPDRAVAHSA